MADVLPANLSENPPQAKPRDDPDEKYLYGESQNKGEESENGVEEIKKENGDEEDDGEFDESDDDDDDNIQVHIGEVNAAAATTAGQYGTPVSWKKDAAGTVKSASLPTQGQKKIDVNAVGLINGQPIYEYDLDTDQDEKPWRKPGADISDYFNYGFTEDTWKQYCEKQRRMRMESSRGPYSVTQTAGMASTAQVEIEVMPDGRTRVKAGPPPDRKVEGSIHVIGSDADARRKQKEDELLALALGSSRNLPPTQFGGQRPMYTALPGGQVMYNAMGQQIGTSSAGDLASSSSGMTTMTNSQGQQIQSIGPNMVTSGFPPGLQYLPNGLPGMPLGGQPQIFPPPGGMDFHSQDHFAHPGSMPPPGGFGFNGPHSDSEFDSDGENRRHRRRDPSRHRRHRDRGDRDRERDKGDRSGDRDRSKRERERSSSSRRSRDQSKSSSERKRHSSRSTSSIRGEDEESKSRSSRRSKHSHSHPAGEEGGEEKKDNADSSSTEIKQEPEAE